MEVLSHPSVVSLLKDKHLLLDTNVFIDSLSKPSIYRAFFNSLKENNVTLTTIELVKFEILKGSPNLVKYKEKEKIINNIIDISLPVSATSYSFVYELIKEYGIDGTAVKITDLFLGATLMQYKKNIYLMTRDTTDFLQRIFVLRSVVNIPNSRGIHTYGIYQYTK